MTATTAQRPDGRTAPAPERITAAIGAVGRRPGCGCDLRRGMSAEDLQALGAGCTAPRHVCPVLDAVRRRAGL